MSCRNHDLSLLAFRTPDDRTTAKMLARSSDTDDPWKGMLRRLVARNDAIFAGIWNCLTKFWPNFRRSAVTACRLKYCIFKIAASSASIVRNAYSSQSQKV
uniref:Uncharacterized protein n=1 Tax=Romanomermis culicivorax TaxID=13658 RepID=A0A915J050_ROMCU